VEKVAIIGAGSWAAALSIVLADNGHQPWIWARRDEVVNEINQSHSLQEYLPNVTLPDSVTATTDIKQAVKDAQLILFVVPSHAFRSVARMVGREITEPCILAHATKGFDPETSKRMTEVLQEEIPSLTEQRIAVISGPSHAEEVSGHCPTTVVVASRYQETAEFVQDRLMNVNFRVYTNPDIVGTEISGALKNIIALGCGISDGLGYGDNAKAALMTRGLAEIARLGLAMGATQQTFAGLAGVGDLIATCTSRHSRNWRAGYLLGKGNKLEKVLQEIKMVVEGIRTTKVALSLSERYAVDMPITREIFHVLFEDKDPKDAVDDLMMRGKRHEIEEVAQVPAEISWKK
jgi:glycerol-3-phosphate dehydrogenase (NAD(P)+)